MLTPTDRITLNVVVTELRVLMDHARVRAELAAIDDDYLPDYWYGVAKGYEDAAERLELLLRE